MNLSTQKPIANPNPTEAFKSFALCDTAQEQAASLGLLVPSKIPAGTVLSIAGNTYTINGGVGVCSGGQTTGPLGILPWFPCSIGSNAFGYCSGLTGSLVIPNSVTSIGYGAFQGCYGFTGSLVIPNSVTSVGNGAFQGCSGLTGSLVIPNSVTSVGNYAFYQCSGLTGSLVIPNSVTSVGNYAFGYCSGLTGSLVIPNSVTSVGNGAFQGCSLLTTVYADVDASVVASTAFSNSGVTIIYYHSTMSGWTPSPWNHIPTAEWTSYPDPMP